MVGTSHDANLRPAAISALPSGTGRTRFAAQPDSLELQKSSHALRAGATDFGRFHPLLDDDARYTHGNIIGGRIIIRTQRPRHICRGERRF